MVSSRKSATPKRGLERQALQFGAGDVAQYYRQGVLADLEKYFAFLQLEKRVSLNTLISYRKCMYLALGYLNSVHTRATDNLTFAGIAKQESGLLELGSLLGKRRKTSKKALDSHAVAQIAQEIALGEAGQSQASGATLTQAQEAISSNDQQSNPSSKYTFTVWQEFTWATVTPNQLQEVLQLAYLDGRSVAARNQLVAVIRSFWNWLLRTYELATNPAATLASIQINKQYKVRVQASEIDRMIQQIEIADYRDLRDHVMLHLMHATGLRLSELCNLKLQDLNFAQEFIGVVGKGKVFRKVPLTGTTKELLTLYLGVRELEIWQKLISSWHVHAATVETNSLADLAKNGKSWYRGQELELLEILGMHLDSAPQVDLANEQALFEFATQAVQRALVYSERQGGRGERGVQYFQLDISKFLEHNLPSRETLLDAERDVDSESFVLEQEHEPLEATAQELGMMSLSSLLGTAGQAAKRARRGKKSAQQTALDKDLHCKATINSEVVKQQAPSTQSKTPTNYQLQKLEQEKAGLKLIAHPLHALFLSSHLKSITPRAVQYRLEQHVREAGMVRALSPHKLRHSFATRFFQTTANIRVVQTVLGHKNLGTTTIYTNPDQEYLRQVYNKSHPSQIEYFANHAPHATEDQEQGQALPSDKQLTTSEEQSRTAKVAQGIENLQILSYEQLQRQTTQGKPNTDCDESSEEDEELD